jgi:hypothetical protein
MITPDHVAFFRSTVMSRRRSILFGTGAVLALLLAAGMENHAQGQGTSTGSRSSSGSSGASSGSTASSVGGGFTGGGTTAGGGFTGGGSTSNTGLTGGSGMTGGAGGRGGSGGSATQVPVSANPFLATYVNPYSAGLVSTSGATTSTKAFGQPVYALFSTATSSGNTGTFSGGTGGASGGTGGVVASTAINGGLGFGYNTYGQGRTYAYAAVPGETVPMVFHSNPQLQSSVSDVLLRSTSFKALAPLNVSVNESTVTLAGTVASAKEKRIVEGMVRMTPGVRAVVNNLQVSETLPAPKTNAPPIGQ